MSVTFVMYHYVRKIKFSKFKNIKGLEFNKFKHQLNYLSKNYKIISMQEFKDKYNLGYKFSSKYCILSFDDGYKDHVKYVLPELNKRKLKGSFYIPSMPINTGKALDANLIHYIIAKSKTNELFIEFEKLCKKVGINEMKLNNFKEQYYKKNRFDPPKINFIKRLLQIEISFNHRKFIIDKLFKKFVKMNIKDFCKLIYLNKKDIKKLIRSGMYIGGHGDKHKWFSRIANKEKKREINSTIKFLKSFNIETKNWTMCYPYGDFDPFTIKYLKSKGCGFGLTTIPKVNHKIKDPFKICRLDTNDIPTYIK